MFINGPILPDLRSGGGFSFLITFHIVNPPDHSELLITSKNSVTEALDEAPKNNNITKGYSLRTLKDEGF